LDPKNTQPPIHPKSSEPAVLWTRNLTKTYGAFTVGPLDVGFYPGETVALLGKNGAGKTTFFELLTGHLDCSQGQIYLETLRVTPEAADLRRRIGYLPQHPRLPLWVTPHDLLHYGATLFHLPDPDRAVEAAESYWDCISYRHKPLGALSYGMQKRVGLALATIHDPQTLILDEPHSGLDIFHSRALDEAIKKRALSRYVTIISTHVAAFAAGLCDRVLSLENGQLEELSFWRESDFLHRIDLIEKRFFGPRPT
jgi:ABC-type multidrug transport system ATPase subunit